MSGNTSSDNSSSADHQQFQTMEEGAITRLPAGHSQAHGDHKDDAGKQQGADSHRLITAVADVARLLGDNTRVFVALPGQRYLGAIIQATEHALIQKTDHDKAVIHKPSDIAGDGQRDKQIAESLTQKQAVSIRYDNHGKGSIEHEQQMTLQQPQVSHAKDMGGYER